MRYRHGGRRRDLGDHRPTGQTCNAGSACLVQNSIRERITERLSSSAGRRARATRCCPDNIGPVTTAPIPQDPGLQRHREERGGALASSAADPPPACRAASSWSRRLHGREPGCASPGRRSSPVLCSWASRRGEAVRVVERYDLWPRGRPRTQDIGRRCGCLRAQGGTVWVNTYRAVSYMMPFVGKSIPVSAARRHRGGAWILETKSVWIPPRRSRPRILIIGRPR